MTHPDQTPDPAPNSGAGPSAWSFPAPTPAQPTAAAPTWPMAAAPAQPGPAAPWPAEGFAGTDLLTTELPNSRPRRRLGPVRIAAAAGVTLALLVGVGAYAMSALGGGKRPAEFTPATVSAYVEVDLAASLEQQIKLLRLATKLPEGSGTDGKAVLEALLKDVHLNGVDVKRDITSWIDKRAAVSLLPNGSKDPFALISASVADEDKAVAGLKRVVAAADDLDVGFDVRNGGALIVIGEGDAQGAATAAAQEAASNPLSKSAAFHDAVSRLEDSQLLTAWVDLTGIGELLKTTGEAEVAELGALKGTIVLGVRATTSGFEARYHLSGLTAGTATAGAGALDRLAKLPADTQIAATATLPAELASFTEKGGAASGLLGSLLMFGPAGILGGGFGSDLSKISEGAGSDPMDYPNLTDAESKEVERLLSKDPTKLTKAEGARLKELIGYNPLEFADDLDSHAGLTDAESKEFDKLVTKSTLTDAESKRLDELMEKVAPTNNLGATGSPVGEPDKQLEQLVKALAGATLTVAAKKTGKDVGAQIVLDATSADNAKALHNSLGVLGTALPAQVQGNTLTLTMPGYTAGSGALGDQAAFQQATAGGPANPNVAVYVDLTTLAKPDDGGASPVKSVALLQGTEGDVTSGLIRVTIS
jgi:hypothetical protein